MLAGLVSPAASPGLVDEMAAFLLHPHVPPDPRLSMSSSPLLVRTSVRVDQGPPQ